MLNCSQDLRAVLVAGAVALVCGATTAQTLTIVPIPPAPQFSASVGNQLGYCTNGYTSSGQLLVTPYGPSCDADLRPAIRTNIPGVEFQEVPGKSRAHVFAELGNVTYKTQSQVNELIAANSRLKEEIAGLKAENIAWRKMVLDETLSRMDLAPERFASQDSVYKLLLPKLADALARDPVFVQRIRQAAP